MKNNIPAELRKLHQWVCFDCVDGKKLPFVAGSNKPASSNRPADWRSFELALKDVEEGRRQHVGFCFSSRDPYVFIDLDDLEDPEQKQVFDRLKTYAQYSVSGNGVHLICRGTFEGPGRHPQKPRAGIFKELRFCLMTGDTFNNRTKICDIPQDDLEAVCEWLGGTEEVYEQHPLEEVESDLSDAEIYELGCARFDKFEAMAGGRWQQFEEFHMDHSTADHAFIAMLCDLTPSNEQVRKLFGLSGMWNAERAEKKAGHGFRGYVDRTIKKIRSKQFYERQMMDRHPLAFKPAAPTVDWSVAVPVAPSVPLNGTGKESGPRIGGSEMIESMPEGLLKELARYSFRTSYYPLQEASVCQSIMLGASFCGRGYLTPTRAGLNLWMILVGPTSCGKDEYKKGMQRVVNAVASNFPSVRSIFGGEIVSGPGIEAVFQDTFRYTSYIPEFGDTFKTFTQPFTPDYVKSLMRGLMHSYNAADASGSIEGRRKAQRTEDRVHIDRPCLNLAGEATPESLFSAVNHRSLATGFLQRFIMVEAVPSSWSLDSNPDNAAPPPADLVARLEHLAMAMAKLDATNAPPKSVGWTPRAKKMLEAYCIERRQDGLLREDGDTKKELPNRAGLKALRIASLCAIFDNAEYPVITEEQAKWAITLIDYTDSVLLHRFATGDIGEGQVKQEADVLRIAASLTTLTAKHRKALGMNDAIAEDRRVIPFDILKKRCTPLNSFATDKLGAVTAFNRCVANMEMSGTIVKIIPDIAANRYHTIRGSLYYVDHYA